MDKAFCDSRSDGALGCRYCQKRWNKDKFGNFTDGYYGCNFLPYWGKPISSVPSCPRFNADGTENAWTLRSVCKVNSN